VLNFRFIGKQEQMMQRVLVMCVLGIGLALGCSDDDYPVDSGVVMKDSSVDGPDGDAPVSDGPVSDGPVSDAPVSDAPVSDAPVSDAPVSDAPVSDAPVSDAPVSDAPVSDAPSPDLGVDANADGPVSDGPRADSIADVAILDAAIDVATDMPQDMPAPDQMQPDQMQPDTMRQAVLSNPICSSSGGGGDGGTSGFAAPVIPGTTENGHLSTVRLTPPGYPFTVTSVRYLLMRPATTPPFNECATGIDHKVLVWAGSNVTPAATPANVQTFTSANVPDGISDRVIEHKLSTPLVLNQGEHVFIAVEMRYEPGAGPLPARRTCLRACWFPSVAADRDYWSNSASTPYPWVTLQSFFASGPYPTVSTQAVGWY
jgi:hypothetical protein